MTSTQHTGRVSSPRTGGESLVQNHESPRRMEQDQELALKLKMAIDQRGRYSYRLNDMASGYAAGKGVSVAEAKKTIEDRFQREVGQTPQEYLDQRYAVRKREHRQSSIGR